MRKMGNSWWAKGRIPFLFCLLAFMVFGLLVSCRNEEKWKSDAPELIALPDSLPTITYARLFTWKREGKAIRITTFSEKGDTLAQYALGESSNGFPLRVAKRVVCLSSLYVGMLDKLNAGDGIVGIDNVDYLNESLVIQKVTSGTVKELAKDGQINMEQMLVLQPDLVLKYIGNSPAQVEKMRQNGIAVLELMEQYETHPLGRAEWIKLVGLLCGKLKEANALFLKMEENYLALKRMADTCGARPTVLTEHKVGDIWYVPGGKSFMAQLIEDAGGAYIWRSNTFAGSLPLSLEEVMDKASNVDVWLNLHFCQSKKDLYLSDQRYAHFKAYSIGKLYNNNAIANPKGGNAYWESGLISPDKLLQDLMLIFHPEWFPTSRQLKYYKKLS